MLRSVVLLSGRISSGKSSLARALRSKFNAVVYSTRDFIGELSPKLERQRGRFQHRGDYLDRTTQGRWVADLLVQKTATLPDDAIVVVDAIRIKPQIDAIRQAFGRRVVHLHLKATIAVLEERYATRPASELAELPSYADVARNRTERRVDDLATFADVVIDTDRCVAEDVLVRAAAHLGLYARSADPLVDLLVGGQYGSEGKGHIASFLASEYDILIRVGGPNAGHTIFEYPTNAKVHQLPSGTSRNETALLVLGPGAVIDVQQLLGEIVKFSVSTDRLAIDPQATIIMPEDKTREHGLRNGIGSTGRGVGAARSRRIMERRQTTKLAKTVKDLRPYIKETHAILEDAYARKKRVFLEGTQGTGLSLYHGSYPWVTSGDTTASGPMSEVGIPPMRVRKIILVCRTYPIRVQDPRRGTSGPMSQEIDWAEVSRRSGVDIEELEQRERTTTTNRRRRVAEFDWVLFRKAVTEQPYRHRAHVR